MNEMLKIEKATVSYPAQTVLDVKDITVQEGKWLMILGANGAGKTTLLRSMMGRFSEHDSAQGSLRGNGRTEVSVTLMGEKMSKLKRRDIAQRIGMLAQQQDLTYDFTVEEIVRLGRYAYSKGPFRAATAENEAKVEEALSLCGLTDMRERSVLSLSGGERQRTFLAQVFAQDPSVLLLDEPGNHLDLIYQKQIFSLIKQWLKQPSRAVVSVVHDLSLAKKYGTDFLLLAKGHVLSQGNKETVMTAANLEESYGMDVVGWMQDLAKEWNDKGTGEEKKG